MHSRADWRKDNPGRKRSPSATKNTGPARGLLPNPNDPRLREYEKETVALALSGKGNTEIAKLLGISFSTVNNRIKVLRKRLGIYGKWIKK